jgi:hypothetical protein
MIYDSGYIYFINDFNLVKRTTKLNPCYGTCWNGWSTSTFIKNLTREADKDLQ